MIETSDGGGALPGYTQDTIKQALLATGASGTIYALVMTESERAICAVVDGTSNYDGEQPLSAIARDLNWLSRFREPWTQKQDAMHAEYFDRWIEWSRPVVHFHADQFPFRYPTAGASEGIFKLMSEYAATARGEGHVPTIHVFEGEYEGFASFARSIDVHVSVHDRAEWRDIAQLQMRGQFWISQPSAIDGMVWEEFDEFARLLNQASPDLELIPDLSYVGAVARDYHISLDTPNIPAFVISHSKPFGGYYHRCGGVFARAERPSLFGNKWFKNLTSIAWGCEMMTRHGVHDLPRRYRAVQEQAAAIIGQRLGIENLTACDVMVIATAPPSSATAEPITQLLRGSPSQRRVRICVTPQMTVLIDPTLAPTMAASLLKFDH